MIGRFDTIFWDIDGTLLDFEASAALSLRLCLARQGAEATDAQYAVYHQINDRYWKRLEKGEITREALYPGRFREWFDTVGIRGVDAVRMNEDYQVCLGENPVLMPDALRVLEALSPLCRQYAATNGSTVAQQLKLKRSGILPWLNGVFISEQMGVNKPEKRYFDLCAAAIPDYRPDRAVIIGDSLSSDMRGGSNAGIACLWFRPDGKMPDSDVRVDGIVKALAEIPEMLKQL